MKHILRICPSPTGVMHLGTLRTAYFNWLVANQNDDSQLILRIDDTDLSRSKDELTQPIYDTLNHYGLNYDITFKQSSRFSRYIEIADRFINLGFAIKDGNAIRMKFDANNDFFDWTDTITGDKKISDDISNIVKNQIIIKSDGSPSYNFASAIDDIDYGVTWVIRGTDHITNTFRQIIFYKLLGNQLPLYSHVGLLCHFSGKKFSKRDSDSLDLSSFNNDAILNFILRLGWSPKQDDKTNNIINRDKAIKLFLDGGNLRAPNCKVDLVKLKWYNKKYKNDGINKI